MRSFIPCQLSNQALARVLAGVAVLMLFGQGFAATAPDPLDNFITRRADKLYDGAEEFRFVSVNMPDSLQIISHYAFDGDFATTRFRLPDEYELRDCVRTVRQMGGRVMRTFVLTCATEDHPAVMFNVAQNPVVINEPALLVLDRLLQICHEEGVRLLVPLISYNSKVRGNPDTYGTDFWQVGSEANAKFKNMLTQLLSRRNHYTGVVYRDDPAIFGWHTGNELVIGHDANRRLWLHDIAAFLKQHDPNHLVVDGRNRPADAYGKYEEFLADPHIDALSYHTYVNLPEADTPAGTLNLMHAMTRGRMPLLVTEIAMYTPLPALRKLLDTIVGGAASGGAWWGVRFHNRDGGFYKHSDNNSEFEDLNWPGFPAANSYLPEIATESALLDTLTEYAWKIRGLPRPAAQPPAPAELLPIRDPGHISWQGATGASSYQMERAENPRSPWTTLADNLTDNLISYADQFCDQSAAASRSYYYRVIARNSGGTSAPSNVVGPVLAQERWFVDELFDTSRLAPASSNVGINKAYAHSAYLEDVALAVRADPAQPASLIYRLPGPIRSFNATVYHAETTPRLLLHNARGEKQLVEPAIAIYDNGKRKRLSAQFPTGDATTVELVLPADSPSGAAIGRVEISFAPSP